MTPERWQKVDEVLQAALDRSPQDRMSFLDRACEGDEALKSDTASLLNAYDEAGDFIEQPAIAKDARVLVEALDHNIGRVLGAYTILERLGAGGMGEVYLAQDRRLNRRVALKILPAFLASDNMRLRRFQREAQAASALNHPNILTIHEVGEHDGVWFIAAEFIDGQTIRELIEQPLLPLAEVLDIAEQVASALATAHAAGIVHRDIKPENIMRRADGLVKILDFGIVKLMEQRSTESSGAPSLVTQSHTELGEVMGTAGYMSPEQARGLMVDERTDIWSLGVVIYEMLAQQPPFAGPTRMDTMVAILEREPMPLSPSADTSTVTRALQRILAKALSKNRDQRYRSALELAAELKTVKWELALRDKEIAFEALPAAVPGPDGILKNKRTDIPNASTVPAASMPAAVAFSTKGASRRNAVLIVSVVGLLLTVLAGTFIDKRVVAPPKIKESPAASSAAKTYAGMSETEQLAFIGKEEQRISAMMGDRPAKLSEEALRTIKSQVDRYVALDGTPAGEEKLIVMYGRAAPYIPLIARSFAARKVPVIIGIYLPVIESAYLPCLESSWGARGLFQFLPQTAKKYGVSRDEMCDVEKMTPAAAAYIADHMAELGDDAESMTLVLLSYNRGAASVRSALRELRDTDNYQRNFWTLFAHRNQLDEEFRRESAFYVPSFFAAAIIGENPDTFELQMPALSTLANSSH